MSSTNIKTRIKSVEQRKQGFISMLAMIVGVVIGSGIFFKNDSMMVHTDSTIASMLAWIIVSFIIILMIISFVEVASSTTKTGEPATYGKWTSMFVNKEMGKIVDYFFAFIYMPTIYILLALVASEFLMDGIFTSLNLDLYKAKTVQEAYTRYFIIFGVAIFILYSLFIVNNISAKSGKIIQVGGTGLKLIPLFTISLIAIVAVTGGAIQSGGDWTIISPEKNKGIADDKFGTLVATVFAAVPSVMYTFDGFAHSAALQNEAKTKNTYKFSLICAIIFIVFIYLISSWAMFATGSPDNGYTISAGIENVLGGSYDWLLIIITFLVSISVAVGLSGFIIIGNRTFSNLSEKNLLGDTTGKYITRNKHGIPTKAGTMMMFLTLIWMLYLIPMDIGSLSETILQTPVGQPIDISSSLYVSSEYMADFVTVLAFIVYSLITVGALINRRTKKIEVEKTMGFVFATVITSVSMLLISSYMLIYDIFIPLGKNITSLTTIIIGKFVTLTLVILITALSYVFINKKIKKISKEEWIKKKIYIEAYKAMMTIEEYRYFLKNKTEFKKEIDKDNKNIKNNIIKTSNKQKKDKNNDEKRNN